MKRPVNRESVPGPWNRDERRRVVVLGEMLEFARRNIAERAARGLTANWDRERADALDWALVEIEKSRAALDAARGGAK